MEQKPAQIIFTNKARCRDCYRCLKACPVKAIKMDKNQAYVIDELCIACGTCLAECPQKAKDYRRELGRVKEFIERGEKIAVSIAPSFVASFLPDEQKKIAAALRALGICFVAETSVGAYKVALRSGQLAQSAPGRAHIATACPAVVNYIEKYHPQLTGTLLPVVSPMLAHAKHLKKKLGNDYKIVFIGPCVAKKAEAERPQVAPFVDAVITFEELKEWFALSQIDLSSLADEQFDEQPARVAKLFPAAGGMLKTASLSSDLLSRDIIAISGFAELDEVLANINDHGNAVLVEPLFCRHGCLGGPGISSERNIFKRRESLLEYAEKKTPANELAEELTDDDLFASFAPFEFSPSEPITEEMIQKVFHETGKESPDDQLNCGSCGYASCRDKAVAVIKGMAVAEICLPFMRRLSDTRTDIILESYPNGVVVLDEHLNMIMFNTAFKKMFMCSNSLLGKRISALVDAEPFEKLASGRNAYIEHEVEYKNYSLICRQIVYRLESEQKYVGIFLNITDEQLDRAHLREIRSETLKKAQELLALQLSMSEKMAAYLGETTAQGEFILENLVKLTRDSSGAT